jgi:hypothetical protein
MKKSLFVFLLIILSQSYAVSDTIIFKNGKRITVENAWEENGQVKCYRFGSIVGYQKSSIEQIVKDGKGSKENVVYSASTKTLEPDNVEVIRKLSFEIENKVREIGMRKADEGKDPDEEYVSIMQEAYREVFEDNGYDFSKTLSIVASDNFNKESALVKQIVAPMVVRIIYILSNSKEFFENPFVPLSKFYGEIDSKNILKLNLAMSVRNPNLNSADYNVFTLKEIDPLLREKWESMRQDLAAGNIEEAMQYFVLDKREAFRKVFENSSEAAALLKNVENLELVESQSDISSVRYILDFDPGMKNEKMILSSHVIFVRDIEDGLWKIKFF